MITFLTVIILLTCAVLAFVVLIQNPKGGGLSGSFGTMGTQIMGVKQSGDIMEKVTWSAMGIIASLCIISVMFFAKPQRPAEVKKAKTEQPVAPKQQSQKPAGAQ